MKIPIFLIMFIIFIAVITVKRKRSQRNMEKANESFWEQEAQANSVRKKNIDDIDYIIIHKNLLPLEDSEDSKLKEYQDTILNLCNKKIINLTGITNTEIKLTYGAPNLTVLTEYDENYTLLVRTLDKWGHRLYELDFPEKATQVLEYAVSINTDISATYKLLSKIYKGKNENSKIESLKEVANNLNSLNKNVIIKYLEKTSL